MDNRFNVRWLGSRIEHQMDPVTIKLYDKFNIVLHVETTFNGVSFFKQYRQVHHRDGIITTKWAPMKKTIYSLSPSREVLQAANWRYLRFISEVETAEVGIEKLHQLAETQVDNHHRYKGLNLFAEEDASVSIMGGKEQTALGFRWRKESTPDGVLASEAILCPAL